MAAGQRELVTETNRCHRPRARRQALTGIPRQTSPPTFETRSLSDGAETMANEQQRQPIEERIGSMVGKIIVLAICAMLFWGYSTTFLAQVGLL
jgi:hypothetical protein